MSHLAEHIAILNNLIRRGHTLEAMERFYADDVTMQENENPPRVGKLVCLDHERCMLANTASMQATLLQQAINEVNDIVFSEWQFEFTDLSTQRFTLTEASVQHWRNGMVCQEKFYYNKITPLETLNPQVL